MKIILKDDRPRLQTMLAYLKAGGSRESAFVKKFRAEFDITDEDLALLIGKPKGADAIEAGLRSVGLVP